MEAPYVPSDAELGRPSRKAATAALEAHLEVVKGEPLRASLTRALAAQPGLGGQERRFAALAVRELSRHQRLLDQTAKALGQAPSSLLLKEDQVLVRYVLWRRVITRVDWRRISNEVKLPGPLRPRTIKDDALERLATAALPELTEGSSPLERAATVHSFPRWLSERLAAEVPAEEVGALMAALNREPQLILRARPPGTREELLARLAAEEIAAQPVAFAPDAIRSDEVGGRIFESRVMKARRLQVQDLGSQLIAELCRPPGGSWSGAHVADVCAGAGGKALALADRVGPQGRVLAGDASWKRLADAKSRARELGVGGVIRFAVPAEPTDESVVLIDAPCSGTGALQREPDQKWKLTEKKVKDVAAEQRKLLDQLAGKVRPGAVIVYATCSLLREENEAQVEAFLSRHPGFELEDAAAFVPSEVVSHGFLRVFPHRHAGGGFFGARLRRRAG